MKHGLGQGSRKQDEASGYLCFRTGDGDKERGTLNRMVSVGCGWYMFGIQDARKRELAVRRSQWTCVGVPTTSV